MEHTEKQHNKKILSAEQKKFIGLLLSISGVFFFLFGIVIFMAIIFAIKHSSHDILIGFIIGSLVVGVTSFGIGSTLHK